MAALQLRKVAAGVYETPDGAWRIESGWVDVECENPHPGCPGGILHEHDCWVIFERTPAGLWLKSPWASPSPDTLRDAKEWLADYLGKET